MRAAFAPMIKFSNLTADFCTLADEYQIEEEMNQDVEDKKEREAKIIH